MSRHNRHRRDANHGQIKRHFEDLGCSVIDTSQHGPLDLIVSRNRRTVFVEVKDGDLCPSRRNLTEAEGNFICSTRGWWAVVINKEQAEQLVIEMNKRGK